MITTTEAIILKSMKYRDSSKLLTVYTEAFGRCSLIANGARSLKNKFGSALEPMSCSTLTFYKKQNKDLHTLSSAEPSVRMRNLMDSFDRLTSGLAICEIIYTSQTHEEQNPPVYALLKSTLAALNATEHNEQSLVFWFQVKYAAAMGFGLSPSICPASGESVLPESAEEFVLSLADGAPYSTPFVRVHTGFRMESPTLHALQQIYIAPLESASNLAFTTRQTSQLQDFFALYYQFHLDRSLTDRSRRFMQSVVM
jgi:DNA repair protein RecO (recombination protein O)